jgi:predicted Fe-Mo cluster-binding NifX family protein
MTKAIAITVLTDDGMDALIDERFGRASFFLLVDADNHELFESLKNDMQDAVHGAGTSTASMVAEKGITDVISGQFGPKASSALNQMGVRMWMASGGLNARQVMAEFSKGNLPQHKEKVYQ